MSRGLRLTEAEYRELLGRGAAKDKALRRSVRQALATNANAIRQAVDHDVMSQLLSERSSKLERRFEQQLIDGGLRPAADDDAPLHYHRNYFVLPGRDFELDFAWPALAIAVEIQGMAHRIKGKFRRDIEKRALATLAGWTVLELDGDAVRSGQGIEWLKRLIEIKTVA